MLTTVTACNERAATIILYPLSHNAYQKKDLSHNMNNDSPRSFRHIPRAQHLILDISPYIEPPTPDPAEEDVFPVLCELR